MLQYASLSVVNEASFGRSTPLPSIIGSTSHDQTRVRFILRSEMEIDYRSELAGTVIVTLFALLSIHSTVLQIMSQQTNNN